jgi:hypothetical protein
MRGNAVLPPPIVNGTRKPANACIAGAAKSNKVVGAHASCAYREREQTAQD